MDLTRLAISLGFPISIFAVAGAYYYRREILEGIRHYLEKL